MTKHFRVCAVMTLASAGVDAGRVPILKHAERVIPKTDARTLSHVVRECSRSATEN
jgi:hypothetical protein